MTDTQKIGGANLAEALIAAQAEMPELTKGETAKIQTRSGGEFSYSYASLNSILEAVLPVLNKHGLGLMQEPGFTDNGPYAGHTLTTKLLHESGEVWHSTMRVPVADAQDPKGVGSGITYARRYAVLAVLGLAPDEDDDGTAAGKPAAPAKVEGAATKPVQAGTARAIGLTTKLLNDAHPDANAGKPWEEAAKAYMRDHFEKNSVRDLTEAEAVQLNDWLEEKFKELSDGLPSDAGGDDTELERDAGETQPEEGAPLEPGTEDVDQADVDKAADEAITGPATTTVDEAEEAGAADEAKS